MKPGGVCAAIGIVGMTAEITRMDHQISTQNDSIMGLKVSNLVAPIHLVGGFVQMGSGISKMCTLATRRVDISESLYYGFLDLLSGTAVAGGSFCWLFSEIAKISEVSKILGYVSNYARLAGSIVNYAFLGASAINL